MIQIVAFPLLALTTTIKMALAINNHNLIKEDACIYSNPNSMYI